MSTEKAKPVQTKKCFIVMPIADMEGYDKGHFSRVYNHLIKPACVKAGFEAIRADDVDTSHYIVVDIMRKIIESDMIICDLSGRNPNVMFELGFRQAFNLPTVLIKDTKTPNIFDIQGIRHIQYDQNLRIDNVQEKIDSIAESLKLTYENKTSDIISLVQLLALQPAKIPNNVELSQDSSVLLKAINDISSRLSTFEQSNKNLQPGMKKPLISGKILVNNERYSVGTELFDISNKDPLSLGVLQGRDSKYFYFTNKNNDIVQYSPLELQNRLVSDVPF